jgi:beta-glucanase (GH16 family)
VDSTEIFTESYIGNRSYLTAVQGIVPAGWYYTWFANGGLPITGVAQANVLS